MTVKIYTADDIMALDPCGGYPRERVDALMGDGLTAAQIGALDIPADDRVWALIGLLPAREQRLFACDEAATLEPDSRSIAAIVVARRHADGKASDDELAAAWDAAWADAWDAAWVAAWDAAWADAWDAAWDAWDAAWDAAWAHQISDLVCRLEAIA